jgi:hypothetical protein
VRPPEAHAHAQTLSPTLVVDAPPGFEAERRYVFGLILGEQLGLAWQLRSSAGADVRISVDGDPPSGAVLVPDVFFGMDRATWLTPASMPRTPLTWLPRAATRGAADGTERLPVIYGPQPPATALLTDNGPTVRIGADVFGSAFFMLTRYEELVVETRDQYGRFPAAASLAYSEGFLELPVVDAYVDVLWEALQRRWPRLERKRRRFRVALSHDVDRPLSFLGREALGRARQLARDALVQRDPRLMAQRVRSWAGIRHGDHRLDPDNTFDFLMGVSERHGLASAFYFLATEEVNFIDGFYTLDHPWIRMLMVTVDRRGHEIGYHGGFHAYRDAERTKTEFRRLRETTAELGIGRESWGGRQHYLRWEAPVTWSSWEAAGLHYDSTLTFAEHVGFRAGTCHEFPPFHLHERRPLRLRERPLIVMDRTLLSWMRLGPDTAMQTVLELAATCRRYEGTFTLLWHNTELQTARERSWYETLVVGLTGVH